MLEVGRITRPHGVKGDVVVVLTTDRTERVAPGSVLHSDDGPLTVHASRPHKSGHIVTFAEVPDRDRAEELRDTLLSAEPLTDDDVLWVHELIGAEVVDQTGAARGRVVRVVENPASDLLELDSGALVPAGFVTAHEAGERIDVDVPDGLFDLDEDDDDEADG